LREQPFLLLQFVFLDNGNDSEAVDGLSKEEGGRRKAEGERRKEKPGGREIGRLRNRESGRSGDRKRDLRRAHALTLSRAHVR